MDNLRSFSTKVQRVITKHYADSDDKIVITLHHYLGGPNKASESLATLAMPKNFFTEDSIANSYKTDGSPLMITPGMEDEFWSKIEKGDYPYSDMLSREWNDNLDFAVNKWRSDIFIYRLTKRKMSIDIEFRKQDLNDLESELKYMEILEKLI